MESSGPAERIAYLGPEGTFTHEALRLIRGPLPDEQVPMRSIKAVAQDVEQRHSRFGFVPFENSIEGTVTGTLDELVFETSNTVIREEVVLAVTFALMVPPEHANEPIHQVLSHPHALAQCRRFIDSRHYATEATASTAEACQRLVERPLPGVAAIASAGAADRWGLAVVETGIDDYKNAMTRFVVLGSTTAPATGDDKTSIAVFPPRNEPGILCRILSVFAELKIDLGNVSSRPLRNDLGNYYFLVEYSGSLADDSSGQVWEGLQAIGADIKFLGSYARAMPKQDQLTPVSLRGAMRTTSIEDLRRRYLRD